MSQSFSYWSICLLCILCVGGRLFAGAWTPEQGRTYLKLSTNDFESYANYNLDGDRFDPFGTFDDRFSRFQDNNYNLYFETGLSSKLALLGSFTYKDIEQHTVAPGLDVRAANQGFADVDLGVRYRLSDGPNVFSVGLLLKLPYLYDNDDNFFQLGNGQEDLELRLLYGRSLGHGFYTGLEAGYRWRTDEPSDEYRYLAELGWSKGRFYTRGKLSGIFAVDDFEPAGFGSPLLNPQYDLTTSELTVGLSFSKAWHGEYSFSETLAGKNTADGSNHLLAVVYTF